MGTAQPSSASTGTRTASNASSSVGSSPVPVAINVSSSRPRQPPAFSSGLLPIIPRKPTRVPSAVLAGGWVTLSSSQHIPFPTHTAVKASAPRVPPWTPVSSSHLARRGNQHHRTAAYITATGNAAVASSAIKAHKLLDISLSSEEGARVGKLLEGSGYQAVRVRRNQNAALETAYAECVNAMRRGPASVDAETRRKIKSLRRRHGLPPEQAPFDATEVLLFHSSRLSDTYETILESGLSNCYGGGGGVFGKGLYFADDLRKSAQYGSSQQVLVCRVALGDCVWVPHERRRQLGVEPACDPNIVATWDRFTAPRKHDCYKRFVGDTFFNSWCGQSDFSEFVVSKDVQVFPLYLVEYRAAPSHATLPDDSNPEACSSFAVPNFVIGYNNPTAAVDPQRWGRMLGNLMDEIMLMDECLTIHKNLVSETIDLTGNDDTCTTSCRSDDFVDLVDEEDEDDVVDIACESKRRKLDSRSSPCLAMEKQGNEADVIVLTDGVGPQTSHPPSQAATASSSAIPLKRSAITTSMSSTNPRCNICMEEWTPGEAVVSLPCCSNALFHDSATCFAPLLRSGTTMSGRKVEGIKCPFCKTQHGQSMGSCPDGSLGIHYEGDWIVIRFKFHGGVSDDGQPYSSMHRVAYLPNTSEARALVPLIRLAFDLRHCFRLGVSDTTGLYGICWGSLHFKTSRVGGPQYHGFPDDTYLERLKNELHTVLGKCVP